MRPMLLVVGRVMIPHLCHATACSTKVPRTMFMCRAHWYSLPSRMRSSIWRSYRPGQCDDMNPSAPYCRAAKDAVIQIAAQEQRAPDTRLYDFFLERAAR